VPVFVIDGHDIALYADAERAARGIEGYDATSLDYFGADGTVYEGTVEGPDWGPVTLHPTEEKRLDYLVRVLPRSCSSRRRWNAPSSPGSGATTTAVPMRWR
jgi:hypothetical protein